MTSAAVEAFRSDARYLAGILPTFTAREWLQPSACPGWTVKDLVTHLTAVIQEIVDRESLPPAVPGHGTEERQEQAVAALRHLSVDELVSRYGEMTRRGVDLLGQMSNIADVVPLGGLGNYPLHLLANAYAFDHYVHVRADLLAPGGPIERSAPPDGTAGLQAVLEWIVAGFPQMNAEALSGIDAPLGLHLTGDIRCNAFVMPAEGGGVVVRYEQVDVEGTITTDAKAFVLWSTRRMPWRAAVTIEGRVDLAERFCDALHVF